MGLEARGNQCLRSLANTLAADVQRQRQRQRQRQYFPPPARIYELYWQTTTSLPWTTIGTALWHLAHGENALLLLNFGMVVATLAVG
jgi:hypothetical protein